MEKVKVVIVDASHGGYQSILELLTRYGENVDITLFEAGGYISFMSCGMELYLEDKVTDINNVRNFRPENFPQSNAHTLNNHEVKMIDADKKTVTATSVSDNETKEYPYDKLILSSGVKPNNLPVPGADLENVYLMRGYNWATETKEKLNDPAIKKIAVVGVGYIGIEAAEASRKAGKEVVLPDVVDRPLDTYLDAEMTGILEQHLDENGIEALTSAKIEASTGNGKAEVIKTSEKEIPVDLIIQAVGVEVNTEWLKGIVGLDERGWIQINEYLQMNLPDVHAVGDATLAYSISAHKKVPIVLATVACREARYVVKHLSEEVPNKPSGGVAGPSVLSILDYHFATSGLNSFTVAKAGANVRVSYYEDTSRPKYALEEQGNPKVSVQLFSDSMTHQLLGEVVLSTYDATGRGNMLTLATRNKLTLEELAETDFFFQPGSDRQWSMLNLAAQQALGEEPFVE